ncbi:VPS64 (YDR200C) and FAR10 (YLR238W) [Zygosaccharomyces parabailii]|nr:VPS64 (YDR200C) and FAR10 (YLR238W) [Zygosaccharomyces parabailii]CDH17812.1 related to Vacuolar protein sorting-associated protein 64 [Zygosaccharomyces bailii ISA1307]
MTEVERNWRAPAAQTHSSNASTTGSNNRNAVGNGISPTKRTRSNSKSSGHGQKQSSSSVKENEGKHKSDQEPLNIPVAPRNKYTHIIILKSLNETFETKFLVVPFKPESLKLGRPVVSSNNGSQNFGGIGGANGVSKQDPQQVPQVRPDNGHFDSRVLSRNHAALSCDAHTGNIYIRDLKSSNGTFVNGSRIDQNDVELKVGDVIDLGTDIDSKFEHRKISAFVEDISVIPLINDTETENPFMNGIGEGQKEKVAGTTSALRHVNGVNGSNPEAQSMTAQRAAFDAAMFGDVNNLDLEDTVLGSETEILSGIFINNSIGTSSNLINVVKTLATEISLEKHEYTKLKSMESFLINYITNLDYVNRLMVEKNDKQLIKLQNALRQKLTEKQDAIVKEHKCQMDRIDRESKALKTSYETKERDKDIQIKRLERDLEDLRTRLEVEKYKSSQFAKKAALPETSQPKETSDTKKEENIENGDVLNSDKPIGSSRKKMGGGTIFFVSAMSIGFVAFAMRFSSEH